MAMPLALPAGEPHPALAQEGVEAVREPVQELAGVGGVRGAAHRRVGHLIQAVADVLPGVGAEDHRVLGDQGDLAAQLPGFQVAQVHPVEAQGARLGIVETQQELEEGGLAAPRGADQGHLFPGLDQQRQVLDDREVRMGRVGETQILESRSAPGPAGAGTGGGPAGGCRLSVASSSISRSLAPAPRSSSPTISLRPPTELATSTA